MAIIGYARVSTTDQNLALQREALTAAGCTVIREEKASGTSTAGRKELATVLDFIGKGDVLVVTRIGRLARSIGDLQDVIRTLKAKGATLKATEQPIVTSTAAGRAFLDMLGVFAEFETNLCRERQMEGIAKAKAAGVYVGGRRKIDREQVRAMRAQGRRPTVIAKALGCSRMQVYRVLGEIKAKPAAAVEQVVEPVKPSSPRPRMNPLPAQVEAEPGAAEPAKRRERAKVLKAATAAARAEKRPRVRMKGPAG